MCKVTHDKKKPLNLNMSKDVFKFHFNVLEKRMEGKFSVGYCVH